MFSNDNSIYIHEHLCLDFISLLFVLRLLFLRINLQIVQQSVGTNNNKTVFNTHVKHKSQ